MAVFDEDFDYNGADSLKENYVLTYYPGTYDATKAQSITVKSGEEIPSMDFMMRPTAVYRGEGAGRQYDSESKTCGTSDGFHHAAGRGRFKMIP